MWECKRSPLWPSEFCLVNPGKNSWVNFARSVKRPWRREGRYSTPYQPPNVEAHPSVEIPKPSLGQELSGRQRSCSKYFWFHLGCMTASLKLSFEWRPNSTGRKTSQIPCLPRKTLAVGEENWHLLPSREPVSQGLQDDSLWAEVEHNGARWTPADRHSGCASCIHHNSLCAALRFYHPRIWNTANKRKRCCLWQIISMVLFFCLLKQI